MPTEREARAIVRGIQARSREHVYQTVRKAGLSPDKADIRYRMAIHGADAVKSAQRLIRAANKMNLDPKDVRRDLAALIRGHHIAYPNYDLMRTQLSGLKTIQSDAIRLVVNEGNEAIRQSLLDEMPSEPPDDAEGPGRWLIPWELSATHEGEDECDDLAAGGPYQEDEYPETPHPNCGCMPGDPLWVPDE